MEIQPTMKHIVLSLIRDDIRHTHLIDSLNNLGFSADHYSLHLSTAIFELIGIRKENVTDELYNSYYRLIRTTGNEQTEMIALSAYHYLQALAKN